MASLVHVGPRRLGSLGEIGPLAYGQWRYTTDDVPVAQGLLETALGAGMNLIDTADVYGLDFGGSSFGQCEALLGRVLAVAPHLREQIVLASKGGIRPPTPYDSSPDALRDACEASLRRLGVETIDLYLLHWPGAVPLAETVEAFEALRRAGKIRHWGVSNFDTEAMQELQDTAGGAAVQANQVLYNLGERGIEWDLQPWLRARGVPVMAYSPFHQGRLLRKRALVDFAREHGMTPGQVAIAWLLAQDGVIAIPKTGSAKRLEENAAALAHPLSAAQLEELDRLFPPPQGPAPLAML